MQIEITREEFESLGIISSAKTIVADDSPRPTFSVDQEQQNLTNEKIAQKDGE